MSNKSFVDTFNKGKEVDVSEGFAAYALTKLGVADVILMAGNNDHENPIVHDPQSTFLCFKLQVIEGEFDGQEFEVFQKMFFTEGGELRSPVIKGGFRKKNGELGTNSLAYDILEAAREFDAKQDNFGKPFSKEQFVGLQFKMGLKQAFRENFETKESVPFFILETDYQKEKDRKSLEEYRKNQGANAVDSHVAAQEEALGVTDGEKLPWEK